MAQSSDALVKYEIQNLSGIAENLLLRIFPESSNQDQIDFIKGGLTFRFNGNSYGSCDAAWLNKEDWREPGTNNTYEFKPVVALEATDALNRGSNGNAQYQRFHHALGAVRCGVPGIYYFRKGTAKIQPDLFGMAFNASNVEKSPYFILDDLKDVRKIVNAIYENDKKIQINYLDKMNDIYQQSLKVKYNNDLMKFAEKRSTYVGDTYIVKYSARNYRSFTDSSQRGGHIAVGEMYLSKYTFPGRHLYYYFPRLSQAQLLELDKRKSSDKEWRLLRDEPQVTIVTSDNFIGIDNQFIKNIRSLVDKPLKGGADKNLYDQELRRLMSNLREGKWHLKMN